MTQRFFIIKCEPQSIESLPLVGRTSTRRDGALQFSKEEREMADFQKRHFERVARLLRHRMTQTDGSEAQKAAIERVGYDLADMFASDNALFDYDRFFAAAFPKTD